MKQIKTIYHKNVDDFDVEVNNEISEGWTLMWRSAQVYNGETHFFAGLERDVVTEKKITDANERTCSTCKHFDKEPTAEPCIDCDYGETDKWEAAK